MLNRSIKYRFLLLVAPLLLLVATIPIRLQSFVLDFYLTPLIYFIATILLLVRGRAKGFCASWFVLGLVAILCVLYPLVGSGLFGYFNCIFYLLYSLLAILFYKSTSQATKCFILSVLALVPIVFYTAKIDKYLFNKINTGTYTGKVNDSISSTIKLLNKQGDTLQLSTTKNYIIDFWFIGCAPCVASFPEWERLCNEYANSEYTFLSVCLPFSAEDTDSAIFNYVSQFGHRFAVHKALGNTNTLLGLQRYPTIIVIKQNVILFRGLPEMFDIQDYIPSSSALE